MIRSLFFGLAAVLFFSQCKKVDKYTQFNLDYTSNVTIPSTFGLNLPFDLSTPPV